MKCVPVMIRRASFGLFDLFGHTESLQPKETKTLISFFFSKGLDNSRQVTNFKKTTKLLGFKDMFQQKLLSSSVN